MGGQVQLLQLGLAHAVIQGDAQGFGGLGCILGHIAGDLLVRQLPLIASLGDVAHVQLLAPARNKGHALALIDRRAGHGHGARGLPDGPLEEVGAEPAWWRGHIGRTGAVGGGVQADDGVKVNRPRFWYSATLAKEMRTSRRSSPSVSPTSWARAR
jgi:hypothetical protein